MKTFVATAGLLLSLCVPCLAQSEDDSYTLDSIVVTGSRISYDDLLETPAAGLIKPADFILLSFTLETDSREETERKNELHDTVKSLIDAAGSRYTLIEQGSGLELDRGNYRIALSKGSKEDSSRALLTVRAKLSAEGGAAALVDSMRALLLNTKLSGRSKLSIDTGTSLTISKPDRYRQELLREIAKDVTEVRAIFGECSVALDGLNGRIQWQRVSTGELLLFIPYSMTLSECGRP
jgi:hypothetical protein